MFVSPPLNVSLLVSYDADELVAEADLGRSF